MTHASALNKIAQDHRGSAAAFRRAADEALARAGANEYLAVASFNDEIEKIAFVGTVARGLGHLARGGRAVGRGAAAGLEGLGTGVVGAGRSAQNLGRSAQAAAGRAKRTVQNKARAVADNASVQFQSAYRGVSPSKIRKPTIDLTGAKPAPLSSTPRARIEMPKPPSGPGPGARVQVPGGAQAGARKGPASVALADRSRGPASAALSQPKVVGTPTAARPTAPAPTQAATPKKPQMTKSQRKADRKKKIEAELARRQAAAKPAAAPTTAAQPTPTPTATQPVVGGAPAQPVNPAATAGRPVAPTGAPPVAAEQPWAQRHFGLGGAPIQGPMQQGQSRMGMWWGGLNRHQRTNVMGAMGGAGTMLAGGAGLAAGNKTTVVYR